MVKLELAKGFRDFSPEEKLLRDKVINKIKKVFEIFGYSPIETPVVERLDILTAKFAAGEGSDVIGELYKFKDQGGRELGLRYEFTFALARYIGMNPQIKMPFKRYQIGTVYRDGPIKAGRYREFYQCDVDIVGVKSLMADAEIISLLSMLFEELNININIEINSRTLLDDIMNFLEIDLSLRNKVIIIIDKLKKQGIENVKKELLERGLKEEKINKLLEIFSIDGSNLEKINSIKKIIGETDGVKELEKLFEYLNLYSIDYIFLPSLARGLGYYTGPIFEIFTKNEEVVNCSLAGGGRWDKMIGKYIGKDELIVPATGVGIGLEPIMEIIKIKEGLERKTTAELYIIPINKEKESIKIVQQLRKDKIKVSMDLNKRSVSKNLDYANKLAIPFVGFVGDNEVKENKVKIKNMKTGKEELAEISKIKDIIKKIKD